MKLHLEATSERGKPVTKSGNNYLEMKILVDDKLREEACTIKVLAEKFEGVEFFYIDYYEKDAETGVNILTLEKHGNKLYLQGEVPSKAIIKPKTARRYLSTNCKNADEGHEFCWDDSCECKCHEPKTAKCKCGKEHTSPEIRAEIAKKTGNVCPKYNEVVLPDENGNCSLCGLHKADNLEHKHNFDKSIFNGAERVLWCDCGASQDSDGGVIEG